MIRHVAREQDAPIWRRVARRARLLTRRLDGDVRLAHRGALADEVMRAVRKRGPGPFTFAVDGYEITLSHFVRHDFEWIGCHFVVARDGRSVLEDDTFIINPPLTMWDETGEVIVKGRNVGLLEDPVRVLATETVRSLQIHKMIA